MLSAGSSGAEPLLAAEEGGRPGGGDGRARARAAEPRALLAAAALALCCGAAACAWPLLAGGERTLWPRLARALPWAPSRPPVAGVGEAPPPPPPSASASTPEGPADAGATGCCGCADASWGGAGGGAAGDRASAYAALPLREEFDFVIVGAGSTGSILGARLAESGFSVLLLEAGGPTQAGLNGSDFLGGANLTVFDVPLAWPEIGKFDARWRDEFRWHVPAAVPINVARGLGGGGAQNAMISVRGQPTDFAEWGPNWQWDNVIG